ncbi:MAG: RNHCP domain-containing protein [Clostridia bacterium]|nr:RNHCP domain-containing protein [Clostridia bacterium]
METKLFTKNDNGFICEHCGKEVPPLGYSSRNHCPFCLYSKHVDVNPGDRSADCGGLMRPYEVNVDSKKGFVITHKCEKCGALRRNKMQSDDDADLLIKLTNPYNR